MIDFLIDIYFIGFFVSSGIVLMSFGLTMDKFKEFNIFTITLALIIRACLSWYNVYRFFIPSKK